MKKELLLTFYALFFLIFTGHSQTTFFEGFENTTGPSTAPATTWTLESGNWAVFDNGVGLAQRWQINNTVSTPPLVYAGSNAAYVNRELLTINTTSEDYLTTPLVTIPPNGQLRFFSRTFTNGNQETLYQIKIAPATASPTNPAAYTILVEYNENELTTTIDGVQNPFNIYTEKVVDIPNDFGPQVYISFVRRFTQTTSTLGGDRWLLDNVRISPKCLNPSALTASGILFNQANLSWDNPSGSSSWEIEIIPETDSPSVTGIIYNGTLPFIATGLTPNTTYKYYVRSLCEDGLASDWVSSSTFTTQIEPPSCGDVFSDTGGVNANYSNNSDVTTIICPENIGETVTVTFTNFNTEAIFDGLYVFNGNSINASQITSENPSGNVPGSLAGSFWGTTNPGSFTSSSPDGCLTFRFRSSASIPAPGWTANVTCGIPPSCSKPISLIKSNITTTSITLGWTNTNSASQWQILALPCNSEEPNSSTTGWITANSNPDTIIGLNPDTCYKLYVRAACTSTDFSDWSTPISGTTLIAPSVCGGTFSDPGGVSSNYSNNSNSITTICPEVPGEVVTVTFTSFNTQTSADGLYIHNGNSTSAPLFSSGNPAGSVPGGIAGAYWGTTNPGSFTSTSTDGCLTFRFRSGSSINTSGWTSNITCGPLTCPKPESFITSAITQSSVNLNWYETGTATSWQVLALPCGSPFPTNTVNGWITAQTNPFVLNGLNPDTCYDIYIRSICSENDLSNWSGPKTINTLIAPPVCGGTFVDAGGSSSNYLNNTNTTWTICPTVTGEQVEVTFTSFATENDVDLLKVYDGNSTSAPLLGTYSGLNLPPQIAASSANGCLTFVFTSDNFNSNSGWTANITCTPQPTCLKPTNLTILQINSQSASLSWTEQGLATSWEVIVLPISSSAPNGGTSGVIVNSPNYIKTGLTAGVQYKFWVRSICAINDSSAWKSSNTFVLTTSCIDSAPLCDLGFASYTNTVGVSSIGNGIGCLGATPNPTWFSFQIATSGTINFLISQVSTTGAPLDVDFILWGPISQGNCSSLFDFPNDNTAIPNNIVDCSFSTSSIEYVNIFDAQAGEIYILLMTNFSNQPGTTTFNLQNSTSSLNCEGLKLTAFLDTNNNGLKDNSEQNFPLGQFNYTVNNGINHNIITPNGFYYIFDYNTDNTYNFNYSINPLYSSMYSVTTPSYSNINYQPDGNNEYFFPISIQQNYDEIEVSITPINAPIAGGNYKNKITYKNNGNQTIPNGNLTFNCNPSTTINSISQSETTPIANGFVYNFTNLLPFQTRSIEVNIQVPPIPTTNIGDLLTNTATITIPTTDIYLANNSASNTQIVAAAYDPNDKTESHGLTIQHNQFTVNDYLYYTIRFENTGTASAQRVKITDVLDSKIDETSILMVSASHYYTLDRIANNLTWSFDNIQLPPSIPNSDSTTGKGYISFKVKLKPGFAIGDIIPNTANIFFDTNPAIVTNTFNTEFVTTLNNLYFDSGNFILYPNPATDLVQISSSINSGDIESIVIFDVLGKVVKKVEAVNSNQTNISVSELSSGVYMVEVITENNLKQVKKLVIK